MREASLRDPLHPRVRPEELDRLRIVLCIPGPLTQVWPDQSWDVRCFGLLVSSGSKAAVMLPWEGPDVGHQIEWGKRRAGIRPDEPLRLARFPAVRFAEPERPRVQPTPGPQEQPNW